MQAHGAHAVSPPSFQWRSLRALGVGAISGLLLLLLTACNPSFNWRNVPLERAHLTVSLPCKPDQGTKTVELGSDKVELSMVGCEAGGALFAMSWMELGDPSRISTVLALWHDAVRAQLRLPPQTPGTPPEERSFARKGGLNLPQSIRMQTTGRRSDGSSVQVDAVWFARLHAGNVQLVHAVVYSDQRNDAMADSFLESITLQ
ncbi:hypothetical protein [Diaphorobacter aerolatus]|uniref:Uncharacterized protein n=1 Tax=Diaphorobacter aerolatus TaxID=1288495 RepID=A0A7H0GFM1_9BURK|nr:hypothetical protein [Diaphorobacter aerolatus]QNP47087.1 hypothetical protein H9K75_11625 [Diaphorobacter aerolatus]